MNRNRHSNFLAQLPRDWDQKPLGDIGRICSGGTPSRSESAFWNGTISWVTPRELTRLNNKWLVTTEERITHSGLAGSSAALMPIGSLLVTTRATIGAVAIAAVPVSTNQGFKNIDLHESVSPDFYYHLLKHISPEMVRLSSGTTFDEISRRDFARIIVPQPSLSEQQRIAEILDTIDEAIRQTEALIAKLKQIKAGLLHDLLSRGLDDNGELRDPVAHPEQFKDSELGRIPVEWEVRELGEITSKIADRDHTTPTYVEDGVIMVSPINFIRDEAIDFGACKRIPFRDHITNRRKTDVTFADVILHRIGAGLGRVRLVTQQMPEFSILHSLAMIRPNTCLVDPVYLLWAFRTDVIQRQMGLGTQSIGVPDLGLDKIAHLAFVLPAVNEQKHITAVLSAHQRRIDIEESYRDKLLSLKRGLMDDLLTGRVRVAIPAGIAIPE